MRFGRQLFEALFDRQIRALLYRSQGLAQQQGRGLRIRLHLEQVPELAYLPWEALYDSDRSEFLALSTQTSLVRYLPSAYARTLTVELPLRVLVVIASPFDYAPLDVERKWQRLQSAFRDMVARGQVVLERIEHATLTTLRRQLRRQTYHVFYFIGHAEFDQHTEEGFLIVEDEERLGQAVSAERLSSLLRYHRKLQLVVLNPPQSARDPQNAPFSAIAQRLVQRDISAAIGLQFPITDEAALLFAHEFYAALADGYAVDAALTKARQAIYMASDEIAWLAPVLYTNSPEGQLFELPEAAKDDQEDDKHSFFNQGNAYALLIGIADYPKYGLHAQSAQELYELLVDPNLAGYPKENVLFLADKDATKANILQALDDLAQRSNPESIVFVFYYGHLMTFKAREMLLVPVDVVIGSPETMINGAEFAQALRALPARHVLLALDGGYRESLRGGEGLTILAAAGSDQGVYEKQIDGRQSSPFSHYLLSAIRGGVSSEDGLIRILDLLEYLQPRISQFYHTYIERVRQDGNRNQQEPVLEGDLSQNFPLALYRGGQTSAYFSFKQGNAHALLIGINEYREPRISNLKFASLDAQAVHDILVDPQQGAYPPNKVRLLLDEEATGANMLQALAELAKECDSNSVLLFYFAGHSHPQGSNDLLLMPSDTLGSLSQPQPESAISGAELSAALDAIPAGNVVVIIDSHYAARLPIQPGRVILGAGRDQEEAHELPELAHGLLTYHLLEALRGNVASEDGLIRMFDLFEYVQSRVTTHQTDKVQHPILKANPEDNLPLALYRGGERGVVDRDEEGFRYDVYLSFADEVASHARQMTAKMKRIRPLRKPYEVWEGVIPILQEAGLRIAISNDVEKTGVARVATPERGIAQSKYRVILLSEAYLAHRRNELDTILAHETEPHRLLLVKMEPLDESQLPAGLANSSIFDLAKPSRTEETFNRLLRALGKARSATEKTEGGTKRALMIGIDKYANLGRRYQLKGCVNDQTLLRTLLIERFGFEARHITLLTNSMATQKNIIEVLDRLAGMGEYEGHPLAQEDDLLFISFSGNSSRLKVSDDLRDKPSGHYSTIVPHDSDRRRPVGRGGPNLDITDWELFTRLQRMQEQGVYLVLLFDCCYCGGFEIPWNSVLLAACAHDEVNREYRDPETGDTSGAWTYHIVQEMAQSTENTTYWDVFQPARAKVNALFRSQTPQLIGDWNRKLFSREEVKVEPFVMVEKRLDDHRLTLAVGEAHGARVGSRWQILPPELAKNEPLAVVTIRLLRGLSSQAKSDAPLPEAVNEFCRAREIEHAPDEFRLSVAVEGDHQVAGDNQQAIDELQNMIIQSTRLRLVEKEAADLSAVLLSPRSEEALREGGEQMSVPELGPLTEPTWVIVGQEGQMMQSGAYRLEEADALERLFGDLEMWARYFKMHEIMPKEANELRGKLEVRLLKRLANGELTALPRHETSGVPMIDSGDEIQIELTNTHSEPLYVTLFSMEATGAITRVWPLPNAREPIAPGISLPLVAPISLADDVLQALDGARETLKIMVTLQYVDFEMLMQEGSYYGR